MDSQLYVQIENKSLKPFFDLEKDVSRSLTLTTIKDYQRKAIVTIYCKTDEGINRKLTQFAIEPIPRAVAGEPKISLRTRRTGKNRAEIALSLNRKFIAVEKIRIPGGVPWKPVLLILLLLLLTAGAAWGILQLFAPLPTGENQPAVASVPRPEKIERPAPVKQDAPRPEPVPKASPVAAAPAEIPEPAAQVPTEKQPPVPAEPVHRTVYFPPDSAGLTAAARLSLDELIPLLKKYPDATVKITGHCAPHGTEQGRQELSAQRAQAAAAYLKERGININPVLVQGLGAREPATEDLQQQNLNRRVEIVQKGE